MSAFIRPTIHAMAGYVPGEQPREDGFIKLNTNENPYPPSPRVFHAIQNVLTGDRLRKYPDPEGWAFRETAGGVLGVDPKCILIGNGSDDVLTILTRTFVPEGGTIVAPTPSYLLYKSLAEIQGARFVTTPYDADWQLEHGMAPRANLTFIANPNSPSGTLVNRTTLQTWPGPLVIDEAYVDFAETNALHLLQERDDVVITRSFSKAYSMAGVRFGYAIASPAWTEQFYKVKDSYNCDVLSLAAATAAIEDQAYFRETRAKILATRARMTKALRTLGFQVTDSQANFTWCQRTDGPVKPLFEELKRRKILVRFMRYEGFPDGIRITVGTDEEIDRLIAELRALL